ncbi:MAG: metallopeptidase TldD-related protein [Bacteroidales bacterium]|nr:metallopeptidase TldD-related protein [Bacteroidales bacterium]
MKKAHIIRTICALLLIQIVSIFPMMGQKSDEILFKAMQDEMSRTKNELRLPGAPSTLFIGYTLAENRFLSVSSTLGSVTYIKENPIERVNTVNLYVGDNQFSSNYSYTGKGVNSNFFTCAEDSYNQIRSNFWRTSDLAYKFAVEAYKSKQTNFKTANLSDEERALPDMLELKKIEVSTPEIPIYNPSKKAYEDLSKSLSKIFIKHPDIFSSSVDINGIQTIYYYLTTEGTRIKEPVEYVAITISGKIRNAKGQVLEDRDVIYAKAFDKLPSKEALSSVVEKFASNLDTLRNAGNVDEYYLGPVLFEDAASAEIFAWNLISPSGIMAYRKPIQVMSSIYRPENVIGAINTKPLEDRINKKVIDSRLNVTNFSGLLEYNGEPLIGSYNYDAQGIAPVKELKIIENGILKSLLSTRFPTKKIKESSGSLRFGATPRAIPVGVAPGVLVISAPNGAASSELKSQLIAAAIEEGLDYAYIVRNINGDSNQFIYKVSVKDGAETLLIGAQISPVQFSKLKRVLGVNKEQTVYNYLYNGAIPTSIIAPRSLLLEDVEIVDTQLNVQEESPLIRK